MHILGACSYFRSVGNIFDFLSVTMCDLGLVGYDITNMALVSYIGTLDAMCLWLRLLGYLYVFELIGTLFRMVSQIIYYIICFMLVILIDCIAFTFFFVIHQSLSDVFTVNNTLLGVAWTLLITYRLAVLLDYDISDFESALSLTVFFFCSIFAAILLLNLLIAIMADSYEKVKEVERVEGLSERTRIIVEFETMRLL